MAQFVIYEDGSGDTRALNVAHVKEFFIGELALSPTERWTALFASDGRGVQPILRGGPDELTAALVALVQLLVDGASVEVYPDGRVVKFGEDGT